MRARTARQRVTAGIASSAAMLVSAGLLVAGTGQSLAAPLKQLAQPKDVVATATSTTSVSVSFTAVTGASSYTLFVYGATGQSATTIPNVSPFGVSIDGLSVCTEYRVAVQAISASSRILSSVQSGKMPVTTDCNAALVPAFGTPTSTADGFTVQITNFDAAFTWAGSVTAGEVTIGDTGLATVTGLTTDDEQTLTVTTTRAAHESGSASVSGARNSTPTRWIGSGDFTMEFWVKPTIDYASAGRQELLVLSSTSRDVRLDLWYQGGAWTVYADGAFTTGSVPSSVSMSPPAVGAWTHVALTRESGTLRLYVAGQQVATSSAGGDLSHLNKVLLGADPNSAGCQCNLATGLLSNVRIVDGTALYTAATITVPTTPVAAVAGTTFLLNDALGDPTVGSVVLDGSTRYEQAITTADGVTTISPLNAYVLASGAWSSSTVVTSTDAPS